MLPHAGGAVGPAARHQIFAAVLFDDEVADGVGQRLEHHVFKETDDRAKSCLSSILLQFIYRGRSERQAPLLHIYICLRSISPHGPATPFYADARVAIYLGE